MHGIPRESLVADGREPAQIAVELNAAFLGPDFALILLRMDSG
jgi:hypothetical protein